jgi:O-acetyl-ADP-ribose deacetylase (regulator of RNase III)
LIRIVHGDLFSAKVEAIVNPVNCLGVPGAGLAAAFRRNHPRETREYVAACRAGQLHLDMVLVSEVARAGHLRFVIHFPTKHDWRQPSDLEHVRRGLVALRREVAAPRRGLPTGIRSIGVPALGCGLGELAWVDVQREIVEALAPVSIDREVLIFAPHGAGSAP